MKEYSMLIGEVAEKVVVGHVGSTAEFYRSTGIPFLRTQNVGNGYIIKNNIKYVTQEFHLKLKKSQLKTGDIIISRVISNRMNCAVVPSEFDGANCANVILIRPGKEIHSRYLLHYISAPSTQRALLKNRVGSAQSVVNTQVVKTWRLNLPPLEEQKRIAAILDKADAIRKKRKQAIELTEQFLRSAFLDMFGDPITNPKGWGEMILEDVADIQSGVTKGRKLNGKKTVAVPYMRVANVQDGHLKLDEIKDIEVLPGDVGKYALQMGDVLLTEGGDPDKLGRGAVWNEAVSPCIHQNHIFRVRPDRGIVLPDFLSALLGSSRGKRYFLRASKQTTGIASINKTQLREFPVLLPPLTLQQQYAQLVKTKNSFDQRLNKLAELNAKLFDSTTQMAFRGEL